MQEPILAVDGGIFASQPDAHESGRAHLPVAGWENLAEEISQRLRLFDIGRRCREVQRQAVIELLAAVDSSGQLQIFLCIMDSESASMSAGKMLRPSLPLCLLPDMMPMHKQCIRMSRGTNEPLSKGRCHKA